MKGGGAIRSGGGGGGSLMRTLLRLPVVLLSCSLFLLAGFLGSLLFTQGEEDLERPLRRERVMEAVWLEMAYGESGNPPPSLIPYQVPELTAAAGYFFRDGAEGKRTYPLYACRAGNDADDAKNRHPHAAKPEGAGTTRDEIPNPPSQSRRRRQPDPPRPRRRPTRRQPGCFPAAAATARSAGSPRASPASSRTPSTCITPSGCKFSADEERVVIELQAQFGNKWARIATYVLGRTDNDVKNFWSTRQKRLARLLRAPLRSRTNNPKIKSSNTKAPASSLESASAMLAMT